MTLPEISRRTFLKRSLQVAGAAALVAAPVGCGREPRPGLRLDGLRVLSPRELQIADAALDTLVPDGGPFEVGARGVDLAHVLDAFLVDEQPDVVRGLRGGLWVLELGAPLLAGRLGPFTGLDAAGRAQALRALLRGPRIGRDLYVGLKQAGLFLFYAQDASWPATGYDGPWVEQGIRLGARS